MTQSTTAHEVLFVTNNPKHQENESDDVCFVSDIDSAVDQISLHDYPHFVIDSNVEGAKKLLDHIDEMISFSLLHNVNSIQVVGDNEEASSAMLKNSEYYMNEHGINLFSE